jgi:hypothetical protein
MFIRIYGLDVISRHIRSGGVEGIHMGSFFLIFAREWTKTIGLLFFAITFHSFNQKIKIKKSIMMITIISIVLAFLTSILHGGRAGMMEIFIFIYLIICVIKEKLLINRYAIMLAVFFVVIMLFGRTVIAFNLFSNPIIIIREIARQLSEQGIQRIDLLGKIVSEFSHRYLSLRVATEYAGSNIAPYRFFMDFPLGIIFYLRMIGIETPLTVGYLNTYLVRGVWESFIPPGMLATFWYSASIIGVLFGCFIFGLVGCFLNDLLRNLIKEPMMVALYLYTGYHYGSFFVLGEPRIFMLNRLALITLLFFITMIYYKWYRARKEACIIGVSNV